jgi:hypothetical protein
MQVMPSLTYLKSSTTFQAEVIPVAMHAGVFLRVMAVHSLQT